MADQATERRFVTINEIEGTDADMEGFDAAADAYAPPPPVKYGQYVGSIAFSETDPEKRWEEKTYNKDKYPEKEDQVYYVTRLVGTIGEGPYTDRRVYDSFMSTGLFNQGTSSVASLLKALGFDLSDVRKQTELMKLLEGALASDPTCGFTVDWEWRGSAEGGYKRIRGHRNFPAGPDGEPTHLLEDEATGETIPARAVITRYSRA